MNNQKTNWLYVAVLIVFGLIAGATILRYSSLAKKEPALILPNFCEREYSRIEKAFERANFCEKDADCAIIALGGENVALGCYKFINLASDIKVLAQKVKVYTKKCAAAIDECAPTPNAVCQDKKCVVKNEQ